MMMNSIIGIYLLLIMTVMMLLLKLNQEVLFAFASLGIASLLFYLSICECPKLTGHYQISTIEWIRAGI